MSVKNENAAGGESVVLERPAAGGVYASLFEKINLNPVSELSALDIWQDAQAMSDATADERLTAGMQVFLECLTKSGSKVEKLDKNLIDHHIAELDYQRILSHRHSSSLPGWINYLLTGISLTPENLSNRFSRCGRSRLSL